MNVMSRREFLIAGAGLGAGLAALPHAMQPAASTRTPDPSSWSPDTVTAAWLGHSTVLLNVFGFWILTDPVFTQRVGIDVLGMFVFGPERLGPPALAVKDLPEIDLILISHAHMDHLDLRTLKQFPPSTPMILPAGTGDIPEDQGFTAVRELDWGQRAEIRGVTVEAIEVNHVGWRYPWEPDRSRGFREGRSYNAYLLSSRGVNIVCAGDTAYCEFFRPLGRRLPQVDLAIMPIGGYEPWEQNHATPEQTVEMCKQMNARTILPIHWKTFVAPSEDVEEPIERLRVALVDTGISLALDTPGATWVLPSP